jgi:thiamine biosynthesis lipoprotein
MPARGVGYFQNPHNPHNPHNPMRVTSLRVPRCLVRLVVVLTLAVAVGGCAEQSGRVVLRGGTMGTSWSVIYADPDSVAPATLQSLIETELEDINQALSTYIPESEISRLNDNPATSGLTLSPRFATVLEAALRIGAMSDGAYDVTVGPLVELWGFGARQTGDAFPPERDILEAKARVGSQRLRWDPSTAALERPQGLRVDLSSIAKGYAVDRLSEILAEAGVSDSLVEIGGELRARGNRPEGGPWRLAVESPDPAAMRFVEALSLTDASVATSGDYRNFFEHEGKRYSHLVDPRSGYPVAHELVSVTVIDPQCMLADGMATALIVMGFDAAWDLALSEGIPAHFVTRVGDGLEVHYTPAFEQYRYAADAAEES